MHNVQKPKSHMILIEDRIKVKLRFILALLMKSSYIQTIFKHQEKKIVQTCENLRVTKELKSIYHQGNTNQNHNVIPTRMTKMEKTEVTKRWHGCAATTYASQVHKLVQSLLEMVSIYLNLCTCDDQAIPLLDMYSAEMYAFIQQKT